MCPSDAKFWMTDLAPEGKAKEWCLADRKEGYASFLNNEVSFYRENDNFYSLTKSPPLMLQEKKKWQDNLMKGGLAAPLCWYKVTMQNLSSSDEASKSTVCAHLTLKRLMTTSPYQTSPWRNILYTIRYSSVPLCVTIFAWTLWASTQHSNFVRKQPWLTSTPTTG